MEFGILLLEVFPIHISYKQSGLHLLLHLTTPDYNWLKTSYTCFYNWLHLLLHLITPDYTWLHLLLHLTTPDYNWLQLVTPAFTTDYTCYYTWLHLITPDYTCFYTWLHLITPDYTCFYTWLHQLLYLLLQIFIAKQEYVVPSRFHTYNRISSCAPPHIILPKTPTCPTTLPRMHMHKSEERSAQQAECDPNHVWSVHIYHAMISHSTSKLSLYLKIPFIIHSNILY